LASSDITFDVASGGGDASLTCPETKSAKGSFAADVDAGRSASVNLRNISTVADTVLSVVSGAAASVHVHRASTERGFASVAVDSGGDADVRVTDVDAASALDAPPAVDFYSEKFDSELATCVAAVVVRCCRRRFRRALLRWWW
jgi:hypothetical protein